MLFNAFAIASMLFIAYHGSYIEYKADSNQLAQDIERLDNVKPMNLSYVNQHLERYCFEEPELQALAALRRVVQKLHIDPAKMLFNFGTGKLCSVYNDNLLFINEELCSKLPDTA